MKSWRSSATAFMVLSLLGAAAAPARAAIVEVAVTGVTRAVGHVHVDLCTRDTFLKPSCPYEGSAPATPGETLITIEGVAPGEYAAQVFHDENDSGRVHRDLLGIPTESIGFSNDAPIHLRGPSFREAAFAVQHGVERITLKLRNLLRLAR